MSETPVLMRRSVDLFEDDPNFTGTPAQFLGWVAEKIRNLPSDLKDITIAVSGASSDWGYAGLQVEATWESPETPAEQKMRAKEAEGERARRKAQFLALKQEFEPEPSP